MQPQAKCRPRGGRRAHYSPESNTYTVWHWGSELEVFPERRHGWDHTWNVNGRDIHVRYLPTPHWDAWAHEFGVDPNVPIMPEFRSLDLMMCSPLTVQPDNWWESCQTVEFEAGEPSLIPVGTMHLDHTAPSVPGAADDAEGPGHGKPISGDTMHPEYMNLSRPGAADDAEGHAGQPDRGQPMTSSSSSSAGPGACGAPATATSPTGMTNPNVLAHKFVPKPEQGVAGLRLRAMLDKKNEREARRKQRKLATSNDVANSKSNQSGLVQEPTTEERL